MKCGAPDGGWQSQSAETSIPAGEAAVSFELPEPHQGYAAWLFADPGWRQRLLNQLDLAEDQFSVKCVEQIASVIRYGDPVSIWLMRFISAVDIDPRRLADALSAALDKPNVTEIVTPTVTLTNVYVGHQTENPFPDLVPDLKGFLEGIVNSFEETAGQVAALALLALAVVIVSRLWPLGGMALLAALLIMVLTDEGGAIDAQA